MFGKEVSKSCHLFRIMYFCKTFEAIHNKDYSVVKTSKTGLLRPRFFPTMNWLNKRTCPVSLPLPNSFAYTRHTAPILMPYSCHTLAILESMAALWHQYGISMASTCQILAKYLPDAWLGRRNVMRFVYLCGQERRRLRLRRTNRYLT